MVLPALDLTRERLYVSSAESYRTRKRRTNECRGRREEWVAAVPHGRATELLRAEWTPGCSRLVERVCALAPRLRGGRILLWGAGIGTFAYPFDEAACDLVVVERFGVVSDVLRTRLDLDGIEHVYERPGAALDGGFDGIVAFSIAKEPDPLGLLAEFRATLKEDGLLVTSLAGFADFALRGRCQRYVEERFVQPAWAA